MPARKNLDTFPPVFQRVTAFAISRFPDIEPSGPPIMRIDAKTPGMAINMMQQFRQYWHALDTNVKGGMAPSDPRHALIPGALMLACRGAKDGKHIVEILHRSQLASAKAIAAATSGLEAAMALVESQMMKAAAGASPVTIQMSGPPLAKPAQTPAGTPKPAVDSAIEAYMEVPKGRENLITGVTQDSSDGDQKAE